MAANLSPSPSSGGSSRGRGTPTPTAAPAGSAPTPGLEPLPAGSTTSIATVQVNGWWVPAGYYTHGYDAHGNQTSHYVPFTKMQLQAEADRAAHQAATNHPNATPSSGGASPNPSPQKLPGAKSSKASNSSPLGNLGNTAAPASAFDNFAAGKSADYSQSQIITGYSPSVAATVAGGGMGASSYSGIYRNTAPGANPSDTLENLLREFVNSGKGNIAKVQQELISAGFSAPASQGGLRVTGIADGATIQAYRGLLENALTLQSAGQQITPEDLLNGLAKAGKSSQRTTTSVNLTNSAQAKNALVSAFTQKLGRLPTDSEVAQFTQALHGYEQSNPSSETQTVDASGNVKSDVTTDKGTGIYGFVDAFANSWALGDPSVGGTPQVQSEYKANQALDFYNAALQSLAGGGINTGNTD